MVLPGNGPISSKIAKLPLYLAKIAFSSNAVQCWQQKQQQSKQTSLELLETGKTTPNRTSLVMVKWRRSLPVSSGTPPSVRPSVRRWC